LENTDELKNVIHIFEVAIDCFIQNINIPDIKNTQSILRLAPDSDNPFSGVFLETTSYASTREMAHLRRNRKENSMSLLLLFMDEEVVHSSLQ
jgi:hypothetical protein